MTSYMAGLFVDTWGWLALMVVMRELRLKEILTEDQHFTQVGLGFDRVP
jgi:predicted nucleic acid-binding protein